MFIHEAVSAALHNGCQIARSTYHHITIEPTNSHMCCIIHSSKRRECAPRWNPTADDLLANDWVLVNPK